MDHFFQIPFSRPPEDPMLEGYTTMGYIAALTSRIKVGLLVSGVIHRYPGILVKTATTLDVLSGGRAYFGIGSAWYREEALGLGVPFPPMVERAERLEETLQIAHRMWAGDFSRYDGRHYQLAEPVTSPLPLSRPHPPIIIGGDGEKRTLPLVARYADACNIWGGNGPGDFAQALVTARHKLSVLRRYCDDIGRDYDEIERTALTSVRIAPGDMSVEDVIAHCRALAGAGIEHLIFNMDNVHDITPLKLFGERIIPAVEQF